MEEVTVNQAIKKGQWMINIPVSCIFLLTIGISTLLFTFGWLSPLWMVLAFPASFILAWLYWSFMVPRWKIWAFGTVRNVHELKSKAINQKLIWPDNSWFNKTEIWTSTQRAIFEQIESKFITPDSRKPIIQAEELPSVMGIKYSPFSRWLSLCLVVGFTVGAIWFFFREENSLSGLLAVCALLTIFEGRKYLKNTPQIVLSEDGISLPQNGLIYWDSVQEIFLRQKGYGSNSKWILELVDGKGERSVELGDLEKTPEEIEELAKSYWLAHTSRS